MFPILHGSGSRLVAFTAKRPLWWQESFCRSLLLTVAAVVASATLAAVATVFTRWWCIHWVPPSLVIYLVYVVASTDAVTYVTM